MKDRLRCISRPCTNTDCPHNLLDIIFGSMGEEEIRMLAICGFIGPEPLQPDFDWNVEITRFRRSDGSFGFFFTLDIKESCLLDLTYEATPENPMPIRRIAEILRIPSSTAHRIFSIACKNFAKEFLNS